MTRKVIKKMWYVKSNAQVIKVDVVLEKEDYAICVNVEENRPETQIPISYEKLFEVDDTEKLIEYIDQMLKGYCDNFEKFVDSLELEFQEVSND